MSSALMAQTTTYRDNLGRKTGTSTTDSRGVTTNAAQDGTGDAPIKKSVNQIMKIICSFDSFKGCITAKEA